MPRTRVIWIALTRVLLLAALFVLGCKPMYGAAPSDASYADGSAGGGGYGYEDYGYGSVEEAEYSLDGATISESGERAKREFMSDEAPPPPPAEPAPAPITTPTTTEPAPDLPAPIDVPKPVANQRQIIYTATMQVSVYDVAHSIEQAEALPDRLGGWLHQRIDNQLILRIPAERLREAMDIIAELGVVDYRLLEALDVTAEYTDLESRIRVLTQMQAQLAQLLAQAKTVEQALEVRKALDEITMELEVARARMRELSKSIAFSTLVIQFVARGPDVALPSSNDPFAWVNELGVEATEYR